MGIVIIPLNLIVGLNNNHVFVIKSILYNKWLNKGILQNR